MQPNGSRTAPHRWWGMQGVLADHDQWVQVDTMNILMRWLRSRQLRSDNPTKRRQTAETLGVLGHRARTYGARKRYRSYAVDMLRKTLRDDSDASVRGAAAKALGQLGRALGTTRVLRDLRDALFDVDELVRHTAAAALRDCRADHKVFKNESDDSRQLSPWQSQGQAAVAALARNDSDELVRYEALGKLRDQKILAEIALSDPVGRIRYRAVARLYVDAALAEIAQNDSDPLVSSAAANRLGDEQVLIRIAQSHSDWTTRKTAVLRLNDQELLANIALNDSEGEVCAAAVRRMEDPSLLARVVRNAQDDRIQVASAERWVEQDLLAKRRKGDTANSKGLKELEKEILNLRIFRADPQKAREILLVAMVVWVDDPEKTSREVLPLIDHEDIRVRECALRLLSVIGDARVAEEVFRRRIGSPWPRHELEVAVQTYSDLSGKHAQAVSYVFHRFADMPSSCDRPVPFERAFRQALEIRLRGGDFRIQFIPEETHTEYFMYDGGANSGSPREVSHEVVDRDPDILIEETSNKADPAVAKRT